MENKEPTELVILPEPTAVYEASGLDLLKCIKAFDGGNENIYLTDEIGRYTGQAITRASFMSVWTTGKAGVVPLPAIDAELTERQDKKVVDIVNRFFGADENLREMPIAKNGVIVSALGYAKEKEEETNWNVLCNQDAQYCIRTLQSRYGKIYLSSVENDCHRDLIKNCSSIYSFDILSRENIEDVFGKDNKEKILLVYATDVFPNTVNKISVQNLFGLWYKIAIGNQERRTFFVKDAARLNKKYRRCPSMFIEKFDEGYTTVVVEDNEGHAESVAAITTFVKKFPAETFPLWTNLFISYNENEEELRRHAAACFVGTARQEMPIINAENKCIGRAMLEDYAFRGMTAAQIHNAGSPAWQLIADETAKKFFADKKRILVSSKAGHLRGFCERFADILDITVYNDSILENLLMRKFDFLVFAAEVWNNVSIPKCEVKKLWTTLMTKELEAVGREYNLWR